MYRSSSSTTLSSLEEVLVKQYKDNLQPERKKKEAKRDSTPVPSPYLQSVAPKTMSIFKAEKQPLKRPMSAKPSIRKRANSIDNDMLVISHDPEMGNMDEYSYSSEFESSESENEEVSEESKSDYGKSESGKSESDESESETSHLQNVKLQSASAQRRSIAVDSPPHGYSKPIYKSESNKSESETDHSQNLKLRSASAQPRSISDGSSHGGSTSGGSNRPPPGGPSRGGFTSGGPPNGHKSNRPIFPIVCYAHKNGCLDNAMRLVAPDIPQLLEAATTKLGLNTAARRVFLSNGAEAFRPQDIPRDAEVFVSKGEAFINPYKNIKGKSNGYNKPSTAPKWSPVRKIRPPTSKGLNNLTAKRTLRVIIFRNGNSTESQEMNYEKPSHYTRDEKKPPAKSGPDLSMYMKEKKKQPKNEEMEQQRKIEEMEEKHRLALSMYMKEKKKQSINEEMEQKRELAFQKFLDGCTKKLGLTSQAKCLFNWKGDVISHIKQVEKIDYDLRSITYGPLWVAKGEWFNPLGSKGFLEEVISDLKCQLRGAKLGKRDLEFLLAKDYHKVSNPAILTLKPRFIEPTKEKVESDIVAMQGLLKKYRARLKKVKAMVKDLESQGNDYVMKNIQEIDEASRLLDKQKGLRVRMYENGDETMIALAYLNMREIQRGAKNSQLIRARFLEALTSLHQPKDPTGPARSRFIRRLFTRDGEEIFDVLKIQDDDEVWISYREDFKPLFKGVLTLTVSRAIGVAVNGLENEGCKVYEEYFNYQEMPENSERSARWRTTEGFPTHYKLTYLDNLHPSTKAETEKAIEKRGCLNTDHFLQYKADQSVVLKPQVTIQEKVPKAEKKNLWPSEAQTWMINQSGLIYSRAFPSLIMCVDFESPIIVIYNDQTKVEGFPIVLKKKRTWNEGWSFTPDGNISPSRRGKELVLTFLNPSLIQEIKEKNDLQGQGDAHSVSELAPAIPFETKAPITLAVLGKFKGQSVKSANQRWAIKQESNKHGCQWRHTKVANPLWRKQAYSWPVLPDGNWNCKYAWPMQGYIFPNVPSPSKRRFSTEEISIRLKVYRNGESDKMRFVWIVAPDLSGMEKGELDGRNRICAIENLIELELAMFLEQATSLLGLNSAARRLFDEKGTELFSLRSLRRGQVVYVSTGDFWYDPRMTKVERQRRQLLAKLAYDVAMIKAYCDIRDPQDWVLELDQGLVAGSKLVVRKCSLTQEEKEKLSKDAVQKDKVSDVSSGVAFPVASDLSYRSAHDKAHLLAEQQFGPKKYSWQKETPEESVSDDVPEKCEKKASKPRKRETTSRQTFVFSKGFISPAQEPNLVLGVREMCIDSISNNVEVELCHKSIDHPAQRWELTDEGLIRMKCSRMLVLGVSMPAYKPGADESLSFDGCLVTVQAKKECKLGRANQKWLHDPTYQRIFAFFTDDTDKEVTAANHVSICTSAVVGSEAICQIGYAIDSHRILCSACSKIARGAFKMVKAPEEKGFVCASANPRKNDLRFKGSFACLNEKVDLSKFEAETTLQHWASQLDKLRLETSLRSLNLAIQSPAPIQACRVLARRNGEGRLRSPHLIIGTSICGILQQCTHRLALGTAARRLYTSDGMHVLHKDLLIEWAVKHFCDQQQESSGNYGGGEPERVNVSVESQKQEGSSHSREDTPDHTSAKAGIKVTTDDISKKARPPSGRKTSLNKTPPAQPTQTTCEIPLSVILRTPIEVWVSCGENFIRPETAEKLYESSLKAQMNRNADNLVLGTEKHTLRHMQGRRYKEMSPTSLKSTTMPETPILVEGGWQETGKDEAIKIEKVHKLEQLLAESRPLHPLPKTKGIDLSRELYAQAVRKRVLIYQKGESPQTAAYVWGESIEEILSDATSRLTMHRPAKVLFNERGKRVTSFDAIERDSLLCVTAGDSLKDRPKHSDVKMKANWARARKECGADVDQITVSRDSQEFDVTNVDPFGPPLFLEGPETHDRDV